MSGRMTPKTNPTMLPVSVTIIAAMMSTLLRRWRLLSFGFASIGSKSSLAFWKVTAMSTGLYMLVLRARTEGRAE